MSSYRYRKSHCGDKTVVRSSYLHNGISYTGKMTSLYWFGPLVMGGCLMAPSHQLNHRLLIANLTLKGKLQWSFNHCSTKKMQLNFYPQNNGHFVLVGIAVWGSCLTSIQIPIIKIRWSHNLYIEMGPGLNMLTHWGWVIITHAPVHINDFRGVRARYVKCTGQVTDTHRLKVNSHCDKALFISMYDITMVQP